MEKLKHECGFALIRFKSEAARHFISSQPPRDGVVLIEQLLRYQLNRGQEGAGMAIINPKSASGVSVRRYVADGSKAVDTIAHQVKRDRKESDDQTPWQGPLFMGHVRYSTTGSQGVDYLHPVVHECKNGSRILMCGNFNLTNPQEIHRDLLCKGVRPLSEGDAHCVASSMGNALEEIEMRGEEDVETFAHALRQAATRWDGGFVVTGMRTDGTQWILRDPAGIRPAYYYNDDHMFAAASERSALANVLGVDLDKINPIEPGSYIIIDSSPRAYFGRLWKHRTIRECVFERIYFSRNEDPDIREEREELGRQLAPYVAEALSAMDKPTLLAYVPETARTMYNGLGAELLRRDDLGMLTITKALKKNVGKRTFITAEDTRNTLVGGAYCLQADKLPDHLDTLIIVDDSIVRGTTFRDSILKLLEPLRLPRIIITSCSPQIRYPDFYGIDMSRLSELVAFRAAVALQKIKGRHDVLDEVYADCRKMLAGQLPLSNKVNRVYAGLSEEEISRMIARLIMPQDYPSRVDVIYLPIDKLRTAIPYHTGDWCFTGDYATPGALRMLARAYINFYEGRSNQRT